MSHLLPPSQWCNCFCLHGLLLQTYVLPSLTVFCSRRNRLVVMFGRDVFNLLLVFRESCSKCSPCFANVRVVTALTWDLVYTVSFYSDVLMRPRSCVVCVCLLPIHSFTVPSSFHTVSVSRKDRELSLSSLHVNFMLPIVSMLSHLYISKSGYAIGFS